MIRLAAAALLWLAACGPARPAPREIESQGGAPVDAAPLRAPVECGDTTCGPDEYCEQRCTCCGAMVPDPSQASGTATCVPLPDSCKHGGDGPECQQRTVAVPCA